MNEIEEFLKRAAAMRARQAGQATPSRQPPPPSQPPPQRALAPLARALLVDDVEEAEVIDVDEIGDEVGQSVARHLDTSSFRERSSHLGESIKSSDESIEAHLHETFEHRLGQLGGSTARATDSTLDEDENAAAQAAKKPVSPLDIQAMFRSPHSLRNAIILSEILNPPHDRW